MLFAYIDEFIYEFSQMLAVRASPARSLSIGKIKLPALDKEGLGVV